MKLVINIPKEFEEHYKDKDRFNDSLQRIRYDMHNLVRSEYFISLSGRYETELVDMLTEAFENSEVVNET